MDSWFKRRASIISVRRDIFAGKNGTVAFVIRFIRDTLSKRTAILECYATHWPGFLLTNGGMIDGQPVKHPLNPSIRADTDMHTLADPVTH